MCAFSFTSSLSSLVFMAQASLIRVIIEESGIPKTTKDSYWIENSKAATIYNPSHAMPLNPMDEFDVQRSFEVMDEEKTDRITLQNFHTLFLGLGFQPKELTLQELRNKVAWSIGRRKHSGESTPEDDELFNADIDGNEGCIPLSLVLEVLSEYSRDRDNNVDQCFQLLDQANKGYVTEEDLQRLSQEIGEPITLDEAKAMLSDKNVNQSEFRQIFAPPSP